MERRYVVLRNGVTTFPDPDEGAIGDFGPSLTRQSEALHTDINVIMAQYERSGTLPVMQMQAMYEDVSEVGDFRSAVERVNEGYELFNSLSAKVRSRFNNDAAEFLAFFGQPGNEKELVELGLREAPAPPAPPAAGAP